MTLFKKIGMDYMRKTQTFYRIIQNFFYRIKEDVFIIWIRKQKKSRKRKNKKKKHDPELDDNTPLPQIMWPFNLVKLILSWLTHTPNPPDDITLPSDEIPISPDQILLQQDEVPIVPDENPMPQKTMPFPRAAITPPFHDGDPLNPIPAENHPVPLELQLPPPLALNCPPYSTHAH